MPRVLEPELMEEVEQVFAYARADFNKPHNDFIKRIKALVNNQNFAGSVLDLGCGPGDISRRLVKAFPSCSIDAIDGSLLMIEFASSTLDEKSRNRLHFIRAKLPDEKPPRFEYDLVVSNSLLHHLHEPQALWQVIKSYAKAGVRIAIMDLIRPKKPYLANTLVEMYAACEPEILRRDFYNSLLAAFTIEEIKTQLADAGLNLKVEQISDRHVFVSGVIH